MDQRWIVRGISLIIALAGAWIAWNSTTWGLRAFPSILQGMGGGLSGELLSVAYQGPVAALRLMGVVLMGVGLLRALEFPRNH